jgi:hypothetical protein
MIKVVNIKNSSYDVYIGRGSKWGNPFILGKDGNRDEVIAKYVCYILNKPELMKDLPELEEKVLGCYCAPKKCHGYVLAVLTKMWMG